MAEENKQDINMTKEEKIGFHKGAISTLMAERNELLKIVSITESLIQGHLKELEKSGVKINFEGEQRKNSKEKRSLEERTP